MDAARFDIYFLNSMKMALVSTIGMVVSSTVAGYVFAKYKFRARNLLFGLVLSSSMIPFEIYMIPLYEQMVDLKLNNTFAGLIIPYLVMSFGIFFMRQIVPSKFLTSYWKQRVLMDVVKCVYFCKLLCPF